MAEHEPEKHRFLELRDTIRDQILAGEYGDGDLLPTEAELGARHKVSRVTVRKALDELKRVGIVRSEQGRGTRVTLGRHAFQGALDMVVLVAPVEDPFFAQFFRHFEATADAASSIVVFKQDPTGQQMASADFYRRFLARGIRDFVLWPRLGFREAGVLPRLRGLGVNVVFFDHFMDTDRADCVGLDNRHAIRALLGDLRERGAATVHYVGWQDVPLASTAQREGAFREAVGADARVTRLERAKKLAPQVGALLDELAARREVPDSFVCVNSYLGAALCDGLRERDLTAVRVGMVDDVHEPRGVPATCLVQPLKKMAETVFACLERQNRLGSAWKAGRYAIKGALKRVD
jgi:DNA-binding LacI/PurR family transcriptional regulator